MSSLFLLRCLANEFQGVFQGGQVLLMPLKLIGHHALVARFLQNAQAFADGHHAVARHGAPDVVAVAGMDPAVAGIVVREGLENEILHMGMEGVRRGDGHGPQGIIVGAQEIAHIHQPPVVGAVHRADQLLHPLRVLQNQAVVFRADLEVRRT